MSARPSFTYTLVAYRADGVDFCRNCVMGRSSSDFDLSVFTDAHELAKYWAKHSFNAPRGPEYDSYEYTLLLNGRDESHDPYSDDETECDPETGNTWAALERQRIRELVAAESKALNDAHRMEEARKAAAASAKEATARRLAAEAAAARDRAEFMRLQRKFGGN